MNTTGRITDRRYRQIATLPRSGASIDVAALNHMVRDWERAAFANRPAPKLVARLSALDPELQTKGRSA